MLFKLPFKPMQELSFFEPNLPTEGVNRSGIRSMSRSQLATEVF